MTPAELKKLSLKELNRLAANVEKEMARRQAGERKRVLKEIKELAASVGMSINDITGGRSGGGEKRAAKPANNDKRRRVAPKYRNPDNPKQTWTGRGKKPVWVTDALAAGKTLDDLRIGG